MQKRPMSRRVFLAMSGAVAGGVILAACAPQPTPTPKPAPKAAAEPVKAPEPAGKVLMQLTQKQDVSEWIEQNLDQFHEDHPDIQVEIEAIPGWTDGYFPKMLAKAAADMLGDICWYPGRHGSHRRWGAIKMVQALNPFAEAEDYDWNQFFEGGLLANRWEGKQWWMSYISEPVQPVLAINRTLADERGAGEIDPDWNYVEFAQNWASKVTLEENGRFKYYGFKTAGGDSFGAGNVLRSYGAELVNEAGDKCLFGENEGLLNFLKESYDITNKIKVSPSPSAGDYNAWEEFHAGRLGAYPIWPFFIQIFHEMAGDKFKIDFVEIPKGPEGRRSMLNEHTLGILFKSQNPQAAWEVLKWSCSADMCSRRVLDAMGGPNAQKETWGNKEILEKHPAYSIINRIMETVEPDWRVANFRGEEVGRPCGQYYTAVMADELSPQEAADKITDEVGKNLELPLA